MTNDRDYYARRAQQERESAARTEDTIARRVHLEMAARYAARLGEAVPMPQRMQA